MTSYGITIMYGLIFKGCKCSYFLLARLKYLLLYDILSLLVAIFNHLAHAVELLLKALTSRLHRLQH